MNINLHIERIILDGWSLNAHQRECLQEAVIENLTAILQDGSLSPEMLSSVRLHSLPATAINLSERNDSVKLGAQLAQGLGHVLTIQTPLNERENVIS